MSKKLWEILVPKYDNNGNKFFMYHHKEWDAYVKSLSGGLTVFKSAKGMWISTDGDEYNDRMIPVRIYCSTEDILKIVDFTITHYDQEAVMTYLISNEVYIKHKND